MTDVPNPAHTVKGGAKGVAALAKNHKPVVIGGFVLAVLVMAYIVRQRQNAAASDVIANPDEASAATLDPTTGYSSYYPDSGQGAYYGGNVPAAADTSSTDEQVLGILGVLFPNGVPSGGGAPASPGVDAHTVSGGDTATLTPPATDPSAGVVTAPVANASPVAAAPHVVQSGPQPTMGPGIFYNADRNKRYTVHHVAGKGNFRYYESSLNRGDWGKGGVVPQ